MASIEITLRYRSVCRLCGHVITPGSKAIWGDDGVRHMDGQCLTPLPAWEYTLTCGHAVTFTARLTTPPSVLPCPKCKRMCPIKEGRPIATPTT